MPGGLKQNLVCTRTQRAHRDWARPAFECLTMSWGGTDQLWFCEDRGSGCSRPGAEIKRRLLLGRKAVTNLDNILKNRDITLPTEVHIVKGMFFSSSHVWWTIKKAECQKNWCFQTVVLEKTLESHLDSREIQPVNPKGNQSWIFIGRTDAEAEAPILWPPDVKNWLIWPWCWERDVCTARRSNQSILKESTLTLHWKDWWWSSNTLVTWCEDPTHWKRKLSPDAGKDWGWEEKGAAEDEMVGWHHWLNGYEFEQTTGDGEGQGTLAYMP